MPYRGFRAPGGRTRGASQWTLAAGANARRSARPRDPQSAAPAPGGLRPSPSPSPSPSRGARRPGARVMGWAGGLRGRQDGAQAAGGADRAQGRPCILHQPASPWLSKPARQVWAPELPVRPPAALEGQGRRPGVEGQGLARTRPRRPGVGARAPPPSSDPPGRAASELGRGDTSGALHRLVAPFQILYSIPRPNSPVWDWENSHPVKAWPRAGRRHKARIRLLPQLLLGRALSLGLCPHLPRIQSGAERPPGFAQSVSQRSHWDRHTPLGG